MGGMHAAGNSRFTVNGKSIAQARAEAYAEVFVAVTASASVCSPSFNCTSVATFIGEAFERVFASAVAKAEVSLDQNSRETTVMDFAMDVQNSTAEIFALVRLPLDATPAIRSNNVNERGCGCCL